MKARITVTYSTVMDIGELSLSTVQGLVETNDENFSIWDSKSDVDVESVEVTKEGK